MRYGLQTSYLRVPPWPSPGRRVCRTLFGPFESYIRIIRTAFAGFRVGERIRRRLLLLLFSLVYQGEYRRIGIPVE